MILQTDGSLPIRKNACLVCSVCFTCSKTYGIDCSCDNIQPRRGKNLPGGSLDSRAKKLHGVDKDDYDFSIRWLTENAHSIYKNDHDQVVGLLQVDEVSLCKAHSSTLYRAKKRHERRLSQQAPPSPADSNGFTYLPLPLDPSYSSTTPRRRDSDMNDDITPPGGLAAKVKELNYGYRGSSSYNDHLSPPPAPLPDFTTMSASTSMKRKRTTHHPWRHASSSPPPPPPPLSSASTPLFTSNPVLGFSAGVASTTSSLHPSLHEQQHPRLPHPHHHHHTSIDPFSTPQQLPPLQLAPPTTSQQQQQYYPQQQHQNSRVLPSSSSLFMAFQQQACISPSSSPYSCGMAHHKHDSQQPTSKLLVETISLKTDRQQSIRPIMNSDTMKREPMQLCDTTMDTSNPTSSFSTSSSSSSSSSTSSMASSSPPTLQNIISTSSTPSTSSTSINTSNSWSPSFYFIRNLAITDTFTFHQLLEEIEMDRPPPGKRMVISNATNDTFYPLHEPIRSVLRDPPSSHVELCLGLCDKPSFDWSSLGNSRS